VIVAIGGREIRGQADYAARVATTPIGRSLTLRVVGARRPPRDLTLVVADFPIAPEPVSPPMMSAVDGLTLGAVLPGFKAFGVVQGGRVLSIGTGRISASGLAVDDVIVRVDMTSVRTPEDVFEAIGTRMGRFRIEAWRDGQRIWLYGES